LREIWKECKSHLCNALRGLWGEAVEKSDVFEWHERFKEDQETAEDDERSCRLRFQRSVEECGAFR